MGTKCCKNILILLAAIVVLLLIYHVNNLWIKVEGIENRLEHDNVPVAIVPDLKDSQSNSNSSDAEINFYKRTTDAVIARADSVIAFITAIAAMFTVITIYFAFQNLTISNDLRSKIDTAERLKAEVDKLRDMQYTVNAMQHMIEGILYKNNNKYDYAIEEFTEAQKIESSDKIKLQLAYVYSDLLSIKIKENTDDDCEYCFKKAESYLKEASEKKGNRIAYKESLLALAMLYGVYGQSFINRDTMEPKEKDYEKFKELLEKSKDYFEKAKAEENKNPEVYRNYAITCLYLDDCKKMEDCLSKAKKCIELNELYKLEKKTALNAFRKFDINYAEKKMGKDKWEKIDKEFGPANPTNGTNTTSTSS